MNDKNLDNTKLGIVVVEGSIKTVGSRRVDSRKVDNGKVDGRRLDNID